MTATIIYTCDDCEHASAAVDEINLAGWAALQDPKRTIGIPVGTCEKCGAPVYEPGTFDQADAARAMLAALKKVDAFNTEASEIYTETAKDGRERSTTVFDEINGCIHPSTINGMCDAVSAAIAAAEAAGITAQE